MAEGEWGVGRLAEPEEIAARVEQLLAPGPLAGRRVLVTAGGTREPLDSVRFVGNRSSGRMGVALAEEARRRGAEVILLAANLAVAGPARRRGDPDADRRGDARRGARARRTSTSRCSRRPSPTTRPPRRSPASGRRTSARGRSSSSRRRTSLRRSAPGSKPGRSSSPSEPSTARPGSRASERCSRRRTPISSSSTTSGEPDIGFDAVENEVVLITSESERTVPRARKETVAAAILDAVQALLDAGE